MKSGIEQLKELVEEKSVAEVAEKAQLSKFSLYPILNHVRPAGKKVRENLFLAYGIPVESWGMEPVVSESGLSEVPVLKNLDGFQLKLGDCRDCMLYDLAFCHVFMKRVCRVDCECQFILVKTGEWCPAAPENTDLGDTVRRVERPDLRFEVVTLLKESTTFHNKAVLRSVTGSGDDILVDLTNFEVYKEI
jgi:hypothetical protein